MTDVVDAPRRTRTQLLLAGAVALVGLAILLGLGSWQLARLDWKNSLQARIDQQLAAPPADLATLIYTPTGAPRGNVTAGRYAKVAGVIRPVSAVPRLRYTARNGVAGWDVFAPGIVAGGAPGRVIFVNLGFIAGGQRASFLRTVERGLEAGAALLPKEVRVVGLLRVAGAQPSVFTPPSEQVMNRHYWADIASMWAAVEPGLDQGLEIVSNYYIDALKRSEPAMFAAAGPAPEPGSTRTTLSNRHLEYAVTWFGLAATLIGVFGAYVWSAMRRPIDD